MNNYDHFIAVDWAKSNMAIARMTEKSGKIKVTESKADLGDLKVYLSRLKGSKILTIEETTTSQWLYTELKEYVDRIFICDPRRNKLLNEGSKTDKADAVKLVKLLRSGLMKEVYHSGDEYIRLRKLVSAYEDLVNTGVRMKNQKSAFLRAIGKESYCEVTNKDMELKFIFDGLNSRLNGYEEEKDRYEKKFKQLAKKHMSIRNQEQIPGIGHINAVKIVARIVNPRRFLTKGDYHLYCGLMKHDLISGGKSYGRRSPRYCRQLKSVYKIAGNAVIGHNNEFNDYYEYLIREKQFAVHQARHAVARLIATRSYGVFKSGEKYRAIRRKKQ